MVNQQTDDNVLAVGDTLGAEEVAVYRWLALHGQLDLVRMAEETGVDETAVSSAVDYLVRIGLVQRGKEGDDRLWVVDPHLVAAVATAPVERAIAEQQTQLRVFRDQFAQLASDYKEGRHGVSTDLETIPGLTQVRAALNRAAEQCREDMVTVQPGGTRPPEVLQDALLRDSQMLARGVRMRTVYHHTARFNSPSQAYVATVSALGGEYRTAHQLVDRVIIFDREVAFMTNRNDRLGAVVVREPSVVHFLYELFEQVWSQAQPFSDAATDGLEAVAKDLDRTILRLLAAGLKDETIARRLGMSLRTTRKHIADMMQALGAESRFQAGVAVSARGLLNDDGEPDAAPTTAPA
ncbi:LuxR C-terminal-related transcriptional regulator [Streptomyces phyllanthi]|uniref:Helix-turn-helix transcriptional regulator n=1 Tax=Streptomyces phyllanthi TaxID=1803180 RepID=A0A5N8W045_9ACTN|nr:helix-turn-helix transcriptional regulator [Streptomyces phyllanthi]MPY40599.1 helix-turn-helix transcriptional regulator [Streptomyces phyllanthi]